MKEPETATPDKIAKFNSMQAILFRIDGLWQKFNYSMLKGSLLASNWVLDRLWGELVADTGTTEEKEFKLINDKLNESKSSKEALYNFLMEKENFLRRLQNKQGKGVAYEDSIDDYMD